LPVHPNWQIQQTIFHGVPRPQIVYPDETADPCVLKYRVLDTDLKGVPLNAIRLVASGNAGHSAYDIWRTSKSMCGTD
jgi:hypothetical protein